MRRFEALANLGSYRFGQTYTFIKVPQVVLNAVRVGLMRELPEYAAGGVIAPGATWGQDAGVEEILAYVAPKKKSRRKTVDAQDIATFVAEILDEDEDEARRDGWG